MFSLAEAAIRRWNLFRQAGKPFAMSDFHSLSATSDQNSRLESVHPEFVLAGLLTAREKSWQAFSAIRSQLKIGMTEIEAREMALRTLRELGSTKNWHKPWIRFGPGTTLTFYELAQADYRLQEGDPVYFDLGPVWPDVNLPIEYEGDVGDTFIFGINPEAQKLIEATHRVWGEARDRWKDQKLTGEQLYDFLKKRAAELGYSLLEKIDGHRLGDFPHVKYSKERLSRVTFPPRESLWILELQLLHPTLKIGAFYEDLLL
jgi:Xaa-Pro aminopeptidase